MEQDFPFIENNSDQEEALNNQAFSYDLERRERIIATLPKILYSNVLDIGCASGFITQKLPGKKVLGIDISENAIAKAKKTIVDERIEFVTGSIFNLPQMSLPQMDLIVVTDVLYPQYVGNSFNLINVIVDDLLKPGGILLSSHIHAWYRSRFPYMTVSREWYSYQNFFQIMEVYCK